MYVFKMPSFIDILRRGLNYLGTPRSDDDRLTFLQHLAIELGDGSLLKVTRLDHQKFAAVHITPQGIYFVPEFLPEDEEPYTTAPATYNAMTVVDALLLHGNDTCGTETILDFVDAMGCRSIQYVSEGGRVQTVRGVTWSGQYVSNGRRAQNRANLRAQANYNIINNVPSISSIDVSRLQAGNKGVVAHDTIFLDKDVYPLEMDEIPRNSRNFVYLESEKRIDGTVPRVYNKRGLEQLRTTENPFSKKQLRQTNMRKLSNLNGLFPK
jgi:hypothetical protein